MCSTFRGQRLTPRSGLGLTILITAFHVKYKIIVKYEVSDPESRGFFPFRFRLTDKGPNSGDENSISPKIQHR